MADGEVTSGFLSKHAGNGLKFRENNYGVGYIHPSGWLGGYYRNSLDNDSLYFGREFKTNLLGSDVLGLDAGLIAGGVTGYGRPVTPLLVPELVGRIGKNKLAFILVPPVKGVTPATVGLQFRREF